MPPMPELLRLIVADLFVCVVAVAMLSDLLRFRIPNVLSLALMLLFVVSGLAAATPTDWVSHVAAGALLLALGLPLFGFGWLGGGDVKLLAATALWMGLSLLPSYLLSVGMLGGALTVLLLIARRTLAPSEPLWLRLGIEMPRVLRQGEGVPYGVAIGAAALLMSAQTPLLI